MKFEHITQDWDDENGPPNEVLVMLKDPTDENVDKALHYVQKIVDEGFDSLINDVDEISAISRMSYSDRLRFAENDWEYNALMYMEDICKS